MISKDYFHLHFIVLIWGFTGVIGVLISIPPVEMVFYRTLLASFGLGFLLFYRKATFNPGPAAILSFMGTGALFAAHWILFFASARISTVSVSLVGYATCAFWTSLLEPLMTKDRIKGYEVVFGLMVLLGIYIIFQFEFEHALGLVLALACAVIASVFGVLNRIFAQKHNHYTITFYEMTGAWLSIALFFPLYLTTFAEDGQLQLIPTSVDWMWLIILSLVGTVYTIATVTEILKRVSAYSVTLIFNMEPVYGIVLALMVFGRKEAMAWQFYLGTLVIVASLVAYPMVKKYFQRRQEASRP